MDRTARLEGTVLALVAAVLFGLVNVVAKVSALDPLVKAGGAYLLAGLALAPALRGARVARADWPRVLAMALVGAALAPVALFFGLERTTAVDA
ncbi:MAG: EamA family transporter, partial [Thermoplasmatota archaeon]